MKRFVRRLVLGVSWLALPACTSTYEPRRELGRVVQKLPVVLDAPALVGASIDELVRRLGPAGSVPAGFVDPTTAPLAQLGNVPDSLALFRYRGLELLATYDFRSRHVADLLLLGDNEEALMQRANLQLSASRYLVLPVFNAGHPNQLLGVRVVATGSAK